MSPTPLDINVIEFTAAVVILTVALLSHIARSGRSTDAACTHVHILSCLGDALESPHGYLLHNWLTARLVHS